MDDKSTYTEKKSVIIDPLTSLFVGESFFCRADAFIKERKKYCIIAICVEHFEHFSAWYGCEAAKTLISDFGEILSEVQQDNALAGYMSGSDFAIIMPDDDELTGNLFEKISSKAKEYKDNIAFLPRFGIYAIDNYSISAKEMYERAVIALNATDGDPSKRCHRFEQAMLEKIDRERNLISEIPRALENGDITFYLQPQYNMATGKIIAMEALMRWIHPERGVISPGEFIPMLEKAGLIANVDMYLWDKVCAKLRSWIDMGIHPVPVSVNVSRLDVYALDVPKCFNDLIEKYQLDRKLVEIEFTENAYTSDNAKISEVIDTLRNDGFVVLMDDFGSEYSSLNMLKNVNVDVLKLDMKFLELERDNFIKGFGIVETVLRMARFMGLKIVMEGVETEEQLRYLVRVGCMFGQGYYMDRPMPVADCEARLIDQSRLDYDGMNKQAIGKIHTKELMESEIFSEIMMNNFLGGLAVYEVCDNHIDILQVNEQYQQITGLGPKGIETNGSQDLLQLVREEDRERVIALFDRAYRKQLNGAECEYQRKTMDGRDIWVRLKVFFLREYDGRRRYCGLLRDVTDRRNTEEELAELLRNNQ